MPEFLAKRFLVFFFGSYSLLVDINNSMFKINASANFSSNDNLSVGALQKKHSITQIDIYIYIYCIYFFFWHCKINWCPETMMTCGSHESQLSSIVTKPFKLAKCSSNRQHLHSQIVPFEQSHSF